eukprot:scaffold2767_cov177-Amphora_coffeaeformis.AAC.83
MKSATMKRSVISAKRAEIARAELLARGESTAPRPRPRLMEDKPPPVRELVPPSSVATTRISSQSGSGEQIQSGSESSDGEQPQPPVVGTAVDQWLTENRSAGDDSLGVYVIRGDGTDPLAKKKEEKKSLWDSIFGGREVRKDLAVVTEPEEEIAPRRSERQSVVAPEAVDLQPSPSKGTMSVVSEITQNTFETYHSGVESRGAKAYSLSSKQHLRKPMLSARRKKTNTPSYAVKVSPTESKAKSLQSVRPKPRLDNPNRYHVGDDDTSVFSYSTSINSVDSKIFAPPAFRNPDMDFARDTSTIADKWSVLRSGGKLPQKRATTGDSANTGDSISKNAEQWNPLEWVGKMSQTNPGGPAGPAKGAKKNALTENLVDAEGGGADDIPSKVPTSDGNISKLKQFVCTSSFLYAVMFVGMASGMFYGVLSNSRLSYSISDVDITIDWSEELNVAFIGNSYLFINDIPRIMEAVSEGHIHQESVIHSSGGSLGNLLLTGNGMYPRWKTEEAVIDSYLNSYGNNVTIYDYGLCSVAQILTGYDEIISYGNKDEAYYNDGKNPCIRNQNYFNYIEDKLENSSFAWDYVVLSDQTKRMAVEQARQQSIYALANAYGPLIRDAGAIPVIVDTHAFWSESTNMTGLVDIPTFQALIYDGVLDYVQALANVLPDWQAPIVAPVGLAFLVVYEENYYLWEKLFVDDEIHSSVHGSYLFSCVLYATMYGHLPKRSTNNQVDSLFANSRLLVGQDIEYPTAQEAFYYRRVAKRVALDGYLPTSLARR